MDSDVVRMNGVIQVFCHRCKHADTALTTATIKGNVRMGLCTVNYTTGKQSWPVMLPKEGARSDAAHDTAMPLYTVCLKLHVSASLWWHLLKGSKEEREEAC